MTANTTELAQRIAELPLEDEHIVHIYPSDLARMEGSETTAMVFSVAVGCPDTGERSVPLYTTDQVWAAQAPLIERIKELEKREDMLEKALMSIRKAAGSCKHFTNRLQFIYERAGVALANEEWGEEWKATHGYAMRTNILSENERLSKQNAELEKQNAELRGWLIRARSHIVDWWRPDGALPPARSPELVEDIDVLLARITGAQAIADKHERCVQLIPPCKPDCVCQFEADSATNQGGQQNG